jgi:hypothetical protein
LIRSLTTSFFGGAPEGGTTFGLLLSAAGSGVVGVVVLLVVLELDADEVAGAAAAAVAPADGASWTPGAVELPHPARAAASASRAEVMMIGLRMEGPEGSERAWKLCKSYRRV